ncbi:MAG: DUF1552 domain-containing protein, partial [Planctomycetes bacterium]|nr:DUF1552 domain-containing protein [Planctomycetota bacterium]
MNIHRRQFLNASGVALALPYLEALHPACASSIQTPPIRRMVCICAPLGLYTPNLFPTKTGRDYESTPYLEIFGDYRSQMTVVSGLSHAGTNPGFAHQATASFLTGAQGAGRPAFRNSISVDQFAAEHIGTLTRFSSLTLSGEGLGLSWTRTGAIVPAANSPSKVFAQLFLDGPESEKQNQFQRLEDGRSILDDVRESAARMRFQLSSADRDRLEEYMTSVRALENRIRIDEGWAQKPKPKVEVEPPKDIANAADLIGRMRLLFELTQLALETDSTRLVTIMLAGSTYAPPIAGVSLGHHDLSHHGKDPGKIAQLEIIERETLKTLRELLAKLQNTREEDSNLLERTMVFFGSNLGDASSHSVKNLPVLLCGGGFQHGQHIAFDPQSNPPLCNLYVSMLQRLGIEVDSFGSSTGTLTGLEMTS